VTQETERRARTSVGALSRFIGPEASLGFGAWAVGGSGWGAPADEADREAAVRLALERGVTFFDTAPTYGDGASETILGRALQRDRERVAIATKVGPHDDPRASLEASLRRLQTEYVDLVQLHEPHGTGKGRSRGCTSSRNKERRSPSGSATPRTCSCVARWRSLRW